MVIGHPGREDEKNAGKSAGKHMSGGSRHVDSGTEAMKKRVEAMLPPAGVDHSVSKLSLIHITEPTRLIPLWRMPSSG